MVFYKPICKLISLTITYSNLNIFYASIGCTLSTLMHLELTFYVAGQFVNVPTEKKCIIEIKFL